MGAYVSVPTWWRSLGSRYRLVVGECTECGAHTFPPEGACVECNAVDALEAVEPEGTGEIVAHTVIEGGAPPEFEELLDAEGAIGVALVELDGGARVPGMLTDCDPHAPERGDRVEATIRRIYEDEGVVRYGAKFRPEN
ncbi:Zn-ribbon domain-containing OB-fold protein [Halospeciosus flavus]|uniref:Zn-ribbon domain-containing OB-fold protein n=1 Tax=Halospeciosus flavus TaxID=3032283 RepID=A0ABD5Z0H6_9EURY|nr:OB-fold domain-containing protein [Halospeciosus flavus]